MSTTTTSLCAVLERVPDEVRADEARAADDKKPRVVQRRDGAFVERLQMRVRLGDAVVAVVLDRLRDAVRRAASARPSRSRCSVFDGSSRIEGASSGLRGRTSTSSSSSIPIASIVASKSSLIETSEPDETWYDALRTAAVDRLHCDSDEVLDEDEVAPRVHDEDRLSFGEPLVERR